MEDLIRDRLERYTDLGTMAIEDVIRQTLIALDLDDGEPREMLTQDELESMVERERDDAAHYAHRCGYMQALEDVRRNSRTIEIHGIPDDVLDNLAADYLDNHG